LNWKTKANIQRVCASLPASESIYYLLQSNLGVFRKDPDPMPNMRDAALILREIPFGMEGKRVMEVGTGRRVDMPVAFYLAGAASIDTVDLYRYMKPELVFGSLRNLLKSRDEVRELFAPHAVGGAGAVERRLDALSRVSTFEELSKLANIRYHAPADARKTGFAAGSIDLQFSYTVFEHIPGDVLRDILIEAGRVLSPTGVACHHIDLSDHFFQVDKSINMVNFLRYDEKEWSKYNDNQFAYHNRLRPPDYERIYRDAGHEMLGRVDKVDEASVDDIVSGRFVLDAKYRGLDARMLSTVIMRVVSRKAAA
jgi:SAM-dependent methyltransferase